MTDGLRFKQRQTDATCPLCRETLEAGTPETRCEGCEVGYHASCWTELGGCATAGCAERAAVAERAAEATHHEAERLEREEREREARTARAMNWAFQGDAAREQHELLRTQGEAQRVLDIEGQAVRLVVLGSLVLEGSGVFPPGLWGGLGALSVLALAIWWAVRRFRG